MGKDVMIKLNHVQKKYPDFSMDCSLTVYPGMITGLIGANGEGKSTTFKLILGLIGKEAGEMEVLGKKRECSNDGKQPEKEILQQTGVVLAETGFGSYFTIHDIIPFLEDLYPEFEKDKFLQYCEEYKLPMNKKIKEFSTGMKRKLQIFAAITHKAKLLLLDEPTSGLDVVAREQMLTLLREYMETEGRAILISSHLSGDLETFCDDIYLIQKGTIIFHEEMDRLLDAYGLLKVSDEVYKKMDKSHIICRKKENFGWSCLTDQKAYYQMHNPEIVIEKGSVDELILLMAGGERI